LKENTLIVLLGPTGVGKTDLGIEIAQKLKTEIISCDSRQIYRELKIGTARPTEQQLSTVKHYCIATHSIFDYYNASMFEFEVLDLLPVLFKTHKTVLMVGGSGLYVDAVCNGIDDLPTIDPEIRNALLKRFHDEGVESLRLELSKIDPDYYKSADIKNPKRVLKALEVYLMTGKPYSSFLTYSKKERDFNILKIGLTRNREELYQVIDQRVDKMMLEGLEEEAKSVYHAEHLNALNTVGYKELFDYFDNTITKEKAIELIKRNSRRYAKRQLSWFARDKEIKWFYPEEKDLIFELILSNFSV
jgi:tRNA dimethylallyltransferase